MTSTFIASISSSVILNFSFSASKIVFIFSVSGVKYNPDDVIMVTKNTEKGLLWLEYGNNKTGLNHIEVRHANDSSKRGIKNIPEFVYDMLKNKPINIVESSRGVNATYLVNGKKYLIAYGKNGFIVSVYPI
ncbi:hypothetical protein [Listeria seeligeri]|uniref:hypothetical protein n=1 Tax=Listeria seeligeri TaxID=1640 RepID=UPI001E64E1A3|nr:hypothetical protein [Listeria seeligeri]